MRGRLLTLPLALATLIAGITFATQAPLDSAQAVCLMRAAASASRLCAPRVEMEFSASVSPQGKLSTAEPTPATVLLRAALRTDDGSPPPPLRGLTIEFDRGGALDASGLGVCRRGQIERRSTAEARRLCRDAIVGSGVASLAISPSYERQRLRLTLFNGGHHGGVETVLLHAAAAGPLAPVELVDAATVRHLPDGPYGWQVTLDVPPVPGVAAAPVLGFGLRLGRLFTYRGAARSFISARCTGTDLAASATAELGDGMRIRDSVARPCGS